MHNIWMRLKSDFQLSIVTLVGICAIIGVTPYAIYRLLEGSWVVGVVDSLLVSGTVVAVLFAWRSGNTIRPGQFLAAIYSGAAVLVSVKLGINGVFWFYVLILFNFFVVPPLQSVIATLSALVLICLYSLLYPQAIFESHYQMTSFVVTSMLASIFAFVFAYRGRRQRQLLGELATRDPLTGVYNRRTMDDELQIAFMQQRRYRTTYGLLVLDLDHFKEVNDRHGHKAGDQVLIDFVGVVRSACRPSDRLFRLGGEEFVLLLPNVDRHGLVQAAKHVLSSVEARLRSPGGAVTVSIGGSMLDVQDNPEAWLHEADECLYQAKRAGRNCQVISSSYAAVPA